MRQCKIPFLYVKFTIDTSSKEKPIRLKKKKLRLTSNAPIEYYDELQVLDKMFDSEVDTTEVFIGEENKIPDALTRLKESVM